MSHLLALSENSNSKFELEKICPLELQKNNLLLITMNNWVKWWNFDVFTSIFSDIKNLSSKNVFFLIWKDKQIIGVVSSQFIPHNYNSMSTSWVKLNLILNPIEVIQNYTYICPKLISMITNDLYSIYLRSNSSLIKEFAYIFIEFPYNLKTENFCNCIRKNIKKNSEWSYHIYPLDEFIHNEDKKIEIQDTIHIFYYNPQYNEEIPILLKKKYSKAIQIYKSLREMNNPFTGQIKDKFEAILNIKRFYNEILPEILPKLREYKLKRDNLWIRFSNLQNKNPFESYIATMEEDILLLYSYGFRFRIFNPNCEEGLQLIKNYQNSLIMNNIESIQSQGSIFLSLITDNLEVNPEFFHINSLLKLICEFGGFLEYEINQNNWIFIGIASGFLKKTKNCYTKQLSCTLIFPEIFRGYSLAGLLAFVGILAVIEKFDIIFEDATLFNKNTHQLASRIGFTSYGKTYNRYYTPNPENPIDLIIGGLFRTYFINPKIKTLKKNEDNNTNLFFSKYLQLRQKLLENHSLTIIGI